MRQVLIWAWATKEQVTLPELQFRLEARLQDYEGLGLRKSMDIVVVVIFGYDWYDLIHMEAK